MRIAVSLPDELFRAGDALARWLKISRSELYRRALAEYVARYHTDEITQRLNAVYANEDSALDASLGDLQARSLLCDGDR